MKHYLSNEKGTALIIALVFLGLLTTLWLYAVLNSSTELITSARYKSDKEAFYAAEVAIEMVKGDGHYFTTKTQMPIPDSAHPTVAARDLASNGTDATGTITYTTFGNPPPGYGFSAKDAMSNYFIITATGISQAGVQNNHEEGIAKILPKS